MPTQLPLEATEYFGSRLLPLIPQILAVDAKKDFQKQTNVTRTIQDVSVLIKKMIWYFSLNNYLSRLLLQQMVN